MPAAIPIAIGVMAAATVGTSVYQGVESNQQMQHAKGAAEAQQTAMNDQVKKANEDLDQQKKAQEDVAKNAALTSANQAQSIQAARQRAMSGGSNSLASTILTGPLGAPAAPVATKTLLGA